MKKSILLTLALSFFIAGSVTQQTQAISLSPKSKRFLGTFFGICALDSLRIGAVVYSREPDFACPKKNCKEHNTVYVMQHLVFPGATLAKYACSMLGCVQTNQHKGLFLCACSALYGYISYKLFMSAEQQERKAAKKLQDLLSS